MAYFALVILPHEWVGVNITRVFSGMTRDHYNLIVLAIFIAVALALGVIVYKNLIAHPSRHLLLGYLIFTSLCIVAVSRYLFVINIECVHYIQYGIGAILIFSLLEHYFVALFITFFIGVLDEGYQYFYLSPDRTNYYDFNDIITNLLGAAVGLLLLKTYQIRQKSTSWKIMMGGFVFPLVLFTSLFIGMIQTNRLAIYPTDVPYVLVKKVQDGIWTTVPPDVTFHVVQPLEGLAAIIGLFAIYYFCFRDRITMQSD